MVKFNLIIPCHNPDKTIGRLFDSLTRQEIPKNELKIIVVDDNSDSLDYRNIIKAYGFDTLFVETNTNVHCPSNTRKEGMKYIDGDWLFFCDQDDYFEDGALAKIKKYIENHKDKTMYVISTIMRNYSDDKGCYGEYRHKQAWLHGKWYSIHNLIKPYDIDFKQDLITHEDIYFNSCVLSVLFGLSKDWDYLDEYTYRWVDNPESITRKPRNDRGYMFENFKDYITAAAEPFWEPYKITHNVIYENQIMMTLLHCYFYYECASYYEGAKMYADVAQIISAYIHRIVDELGMDLDYIVDYLYVDPYKYYGVLEDCEIYSPKFIPKTSLRDFIYRLGKKEDK